MFSSQLCVCLHTFAFFLSRFKLYLQHMVGFVCEEHSVVPGLCEQVFKDVTVTPQRWEFACGGDPAETLAGQGTPTLTYKPYDLRQHTPHNSSLKRFYYCRFQSRLPAALHTRGGDAPPTRGPAPHGPAGLQPPSLPPSLSLRHIRARRRGGAGPGGLLLPAAPFPAAGDGGAALSGARPRAPPPLLLLLLRAGLGGCGAGAAGGPQLPAPGC